MNKKPVLYVPLITPLRRKGAIDVQAMAVLGRSILEQGAVGLVLFGTLGEAQSFSVEERKAALDALATSELPLDKVIVGTGAAACADVIDLSRHALSVGCFRQLLLPPFFFKGITDDGLFAFLAGAIKGAADDRLRVILYDIPSVVSVAIAPGVIERLVSVFGPTIAGIKDSVASWEHVERSLTRFPGLDVFVGNEIYLPKAIGLGSAGAISGLGNIAPRQMASIVASGADGALFKTMCGLFDEIAKHPVIPTVKALTAKARGMPRLAETKPPLVAFDLEAAPEVVAAADAFLAAGS